MAGAKASSAKSNVVRKPVTARGIELLKQISANGGMYLTNDEGQAAVQAGHATVDLNNTQGDTAFVTLTEAGSAMVAPPAAAEPKAALAAIEIDDAIPIPEKKRGGRRGSKYPFDALEVGKSFHVPKTKDNPDPVSALASSLTQARKRFSKPMIDAEGKPVLETVKIKTYKLDASGKRIKGEDGKWQVSGEVLTTRQKMQDQRDFTVAQVGTEDPRGPGARVWRTK